MLNLSKFDPLTIGKGKVVVIIGKRGTGKSLLVRDIMYAKRDIPAGIVMSGTEDGNGFYKQFVPDCFIFSKFDEKALERLLKRQRELSVKQRATDVFVILDDLMYDRSVMKSETMRQLLFNGRHWKIFLIVTAQFVTNLPAEIRANCDYVVACREVIASNRKRLHEMFFGIFPTRRMFEVVFQKCTAGYEVLVMDNTKMSNKIEDCVFWYKATANPPPFRVGHPMFWAFHDRMYNPVGDPSLRTFT